MSKGISRFRSCVLLVPCLALGLGRNGLALTRCQVALTRLAQSSGDGAGIQLPDFYNSHIQDVETYGAPRFGNGSRFELSLDHSRGGLEFEIENHPDHGVFQGRVSFNLEGAERERFIQLARNNHALPEPLRERILSGLNSPASVAARCVLENAGEAEALLTFLKTSGLAFAPADSRVRPRSLGSNVPVSASTLGFLGEHLQGYDTFGALEPGEGMRFELSGEAPFQSRVSLDATQNTFGGVTVSSLRAVVHSPSASEIAQLDQAISRAGVSAATKARWQQAVASGEYLWATGRQETAALLALFPDSGIAFQTSSPPVASGR